MTACIAAWLLGFHQLYPAEQYLKAAAGWSISDAQLLLVAPWKHEELCVCFISVVTVVIIVGS